MTHTKLIDRITTEDYKKSHNLSDYIAYLFSLGRVYGIILNHLSSIKHMHKFLGHDLTWDSDYRYKLLLRGVQRYLGTAVQR